MVAADTLHQAGSGGGREVSNAATLPPPAAKTHEKSVPKPLDNHWSEGPG